MRWPAVLAVVAGLAGCGENAASAPFDGLPLDGDFTVGVDAPVHVARDRYGTAHILAGSLGDAAFVQGYVTAHDRLPQMDVLRRLGDGTLAELYGALDPSVIDLDLEIRLHRMAQQAAATLERMQSATAPAVDRDVVQLVERFADGVNAYVRDLERGYWTIDPGLLAGFDPATFRPWSPVDSLVVVRFEAFSQSWSAPREIDATELYQKLRATFDGADPGNPAAVARRGISRDLLRLTPVGTVSTIAGFPNVAVDTGSRSDGSDPSPPAAGRPPIAPFAAPFAAPPRPTVPQAVLDAARAFFAPPAPGGAIAALGPLAFGPPRAGGNAWAVGPALAGTGHALLAADLQLPLTNPAMLYPIHLIVQRGPDDSGAPPPAEPDLDVLGVTLPGIPGVLIGSNRHLAWAATAAGHDVDDVYLEQIAPCGGGGDCVAWTDPGDPGGTPRSVPIETFTADIQIGTLGAITGHTMASYELVPHHGPIVPAIDRTRHALIARTAPAALSIRSTGDGPSFELRALYQLARAGDVHAGFAALADSARGRSWTLIDDQQHIGWTTQAQIPLRPPGAYAWDPLVRQDALAPFFVLPGDGTADWIAGAVLSPRYIPHAVDPAQGTLITANADPVGATFDGRPLDQATTDGQPLYVGVAYDAGLREDRIAALVGSGGAGGAMTPAITPAITIDDMARIQRDTRSTVGARLTPAIRAALARLDSPAGTPGDLAPYVAALPAADRARLATARTLFDGWTFATPPAAEPSDPPDPDSAATAVFHTWMHFFIQRTLADELAAVDFDVWRLDDGQLLRIVDALLDDPKSLVTSPATQQPILCDDYAAPGPDVSCTVQVLAALVDAMTYLESPSGFGTADPQGWRWGKLHRLAIAPLASGAGGAGAALGLPAPGDPDPAGFPRAGDGFTLNRADPGWSDLDFSELAGPAHRLVVEARAGRPIAVRWALPGGAIQDRRSPHYRDLLDRFYLTDQLFDAPSSIDEIVAAGESRWVFH
ncbi:MAG TPA: penicillin acylase family protein [Kofleriaceae bacterium]|jgi:penicillin amidase|nr:penicillin acylase family protein [Kofleriaceae bacterium]